MDHDGNEEGDGNGDKGGNLAAVTATKRVMATATRVAGDKDGNGDGSKSFGNGNEGGG